MIKAVYTYKTLTVHSDELMKKFAQSGDSKFDSQPTNCKIEMSKRTEGKNTFIRLDIYYQSLADFEQRRAFELAHADWQEIWFSPNNQHTLESLEIFELLSA